MFYTLLPSLLLLVSVHAQQIFNVTVGGANGELVYNPTTVNAQPGDQVVFTFNPKNHTVTQSSFAQPCNALQGGFDSGFKPVQAGAASPAPFTVTVNDTNPIWVYCRQAANTPQSHCGQGMVFAVNPGADGSQNSFANFQAAALAVGAGLQTTTALASTSAPASTTYTASYGGVTIPPPPQVITVTETITVQTSTWTTTYGSYPGSPAPTPHSLEGNVIRVIVGANGSLTYNPSRVDALPRDTVVFEFHQKNHTATQSSFEAPCLPESGGFASGFQPVASNVTSSFPTFNVTVNDTAPIWVFCGQTGHCGAGMVFAINSVENSTRNFAAFQALAKELNGTGASTSASSSAPASTQSASGSNGNSNGVIGLAVPASLAFSALAVLGSFILA
ncbi:hypothetical protein OF83DRAFT_1171065 [Amylostereum chailletii]|nr:hypothetical protein OF83DRAFT_1171065 [Amylostereum chailletii]